MTDTPTPRVDAESGEACFTESGCAAEVVNADFARALERDLAACRAALREISEYWNGDRNDSAMFDALTHIDEVARAIMQSTGEGEGK